MKIATVALCLGSAAAFAPAQQGRVERLTSLNAEQSRKAFLAQAAGLSAAMLAVPYPAFAAKYGSIGAGSSAVLDPSEAEVDVDVLKSDSVQKALQKVKDYQTTVQKMKAGLGTDSQLNVRPTILKDLDFAALRTNMNTLNTAFEEDTQRGTDRLIRAILQDITELEAANSVKDGAARSPRRLEIMQGKLDKLDQAFSDYIAFAN